MKDLSLSIGGANRGGREFTDAYIENGFSGPEILMIADPKEDRAERLAELWRSRYNISAVSKRRFSEDVVDELRDYKTVMLCMDDPYSMADVIDSSPTRRNNLQFQLIGRPASPQFSPMGFAGTIYNQDMETRQKTARLLRNLLVNVEPISSQYMNQSIMDSYEIRHLRRQISRFSANQVARLLHKDGGKDEQSILWLFWHNKEYPLVVNTGELSDTYRELEQRAIEVRHPLIEERFDFASVIVRPNDVRIFIVKTIERKRKIDLYIPFTRTEAGTRHSTVTD